MIQCDQRFLCEGMTKFCMSELGDYKLCPFYIDLGQFDSDKELAKDGKEKQEAIQ